MNPLPPCLAESAAEQLLPSGRSVIVKTADGREELEIRSPQGEMEVRIVLTETGPVVQLRGARLELESPEMIALNCRRLEVNAVEDVRIAGRELRVRTEADIHMDGATIRLNCEEAH
jgi:phage gp45-like